LDPVKPAGLGHGSALCQDRVIVDALDDVGRLKFTHDQTPMVAPAAECAEFDSPSGQPRASALVAGGSAPRWQAGLRRINALPTKSFQVLIYEWSGYPLILDVRCQAYVLE
jgi:hypothetical protein